MNIDQQKYNKAMQEATNACNSAYRVRYYFEWLANIERDNPARREQIEGWCATATRAENIAKDAMKTLSHVYDVMLKWEREDKDKEYRAEKEA